MKDKFFNFVNNKFVAGGVGGAVTALVASAPTWAAEGSGFTFAITSDMLTPVTSAISSGLTTLVPIGLTVMGAMIGISLIPRIIYKFL